MFNRSKNGKSTLAKDVAKMASGTLIAQIVGIAVYPVVSRLFEPAAFGVVGLFLSFINIIGVNASFRYNMAIVITDSDEDARSVFGLCITSTILSVSVVSIGLFFGGDLLSQWLSEPALLDFLYFIPAGALLISMIEIVRQWHIRSKAFGSASAGEAINASVNSIGQLSYGFSGFTGGMHLIYAALIGRVVSLISYLMRIPNHRSLFSASTFRLSGMLRQAKVHKKFLQFSTFSGVINKISWELPSFLLTGFFGTTVLGYYFFGHRLLRLPVSLIGGSIGKVYFQRASVAYNEHGNLKDVTLLVLDRMIRIGFMPFLVLTFIGEAAFTIVFGPDWSEAGVYTQILSIWTFVWFISGPLSNVFSVTNQQDKMLKYQSLIFVSRLAALVAGGLLGDARLAILFFAIAGVISYGLVLLFILRTADVTFIESLGLFKSQILPGLLVILAMTSTLYLTSNHFIITGSGLLLIILYFIMAFSRNPELQEMIKNTFK